MLNAKRNREDVVRDIRSWHAVLLPDGTEFLLDFESPELVESVLDKVSNHELSEYVSSEGLKGQNKAEPPSIKMMRQHELVDYEPSSDAGNFRLYPKGHLIFSLLKDWAHEIAVNRFGAIQIDSPVIYDWSDSEIRDQAGSFHERHYIVKAPDNPEGEFILRFAGDFGLFKIMKQTKMSHKVLPLRIYEFSKSFRYERRGELSGLKRLRAFHMPDIHCFCKDIDQGWDEYEHLYRNYADLADGSGVSYAIGFRIVEEFYQKHKNRIVSLLKYSNRPAFIEVLSDMKHYWAVKHEFQGIDSVGGNVQLSTVQLDVKDAAVYGINFIDSDGGKKGCIICHSSIGSIERWMYSILEEALKKPVPSLPLWLAPAQVRLIPVAQSHVDHCLSLLMEGIRAEVDDSNETVGKKIARAGIDWIPYVAVVGDKEIESGKLTVNRRVDGLMVRMTLDELISEIQDQCAGMPYRPLPLPKLLSRRPVFFG